MKRITTFVRPFKLEVILDPNRLDPLIERIVSVVPRAKISNGRILISGIENLVRIRSGEMEISAP
ncbi:MAG: hypothetical protein EXR88_02260 [Gammaproteobacteria bacterium]|nr:hypothetical protein [Gammaproteobacteria bacterium]